MGLTEVSPDHTAVLSCYGCKRYGAYLFSPIGPPALLIVAWNRAQTEDQMVRL